MTRKHWTVARGLLVALMIPAAGARAFAQSGAEAVDRCDAMPTDAERFACLKDYVLSVEPHDGAEAAAPAASAEPSGGQAGARSVAAAPASPAPTAAQPEPRAAMATASAPAPAGTASAAAEEPRRRFPSLRIPFTGGGSRDDGERAGEEAADAPAAAPVDAEGRDALGAEQVMARNDDEGAPRQETPHYAYTIVNVGATFYGGLQVELDNGQVWRQDRDDGQRILLHDDDPMAVEIWRTGVFGGSYRMRLVEQRRTIRVERVR